MSDPLYPRSTFTTQSLFLFTFGAAAAVAVFATPHPVTRLMGWIGIAVFLLVRRQRTLFWMHLSIPLFLGGMVFVLGNDNSFFTPALTAERGSWMHLNYCIGEAGMFLSMISLPFSFFRVDS